MTFRTFLLIFVAVSAFLLLTPYAGINIFGSTNYSQVAPKTTKQPTEKSETKNSAQKQELSSVEELLEK